MLKKDVIDWYGGVRATARALRLTPAAVSKWSAVVPELSARRIAEDTRGAVALRMEDYRREVSA